MKRTFNKQIIVAYILQFQYIERIILAIMQKVKITHEINNHKALKKVS